MIRNLFQKVLENRETYIANNHGSSAGFPDTPKAAPRPKKRKASRRRFKGPTEIRVRTTFTGTEIGGTVKKGTQETDVTITMVCYYVAQVT